MTFPMKLEDCVNLEKDRSITLAAMIAGTDDYPGRVENYQMRVKILEELKQRAKRKPSPGAYSLASACAGMMKDDESKRQIRADYANSGLLGRIFTGVEDYLPVKGAAVYLEAKINQIRRLPTTIKTNRLMRKYERANKELLALLPERYRPAEPTAENLVEATGKWIEDMRKISMEMRKEMEEKIKEDVNWLPEEYRPEVVTMETFVEAAQRYINEKPDEYIARVRERAKSGK